MGRCGELDEVRGLQRIRDAHTAEKDDVSAAQNNFWQTYWKLSGSLVLSQSLIINQVSLRYI